MEVTGVIRQQTLGQVPNGTQHDFISNITVATEVCSCRATLRMYSTTVAFSRLTRQANVAGGLAGMKLILVACSVRQAQRDVPRAPNETISDAAFEQFWSENADNRIAARNSIVASVCPQLCNVFDPKLALLLVLLGGVQGAHGSSNTRGNCHMLLVGDPGVGKSQLMKFAANKLASRCDLLWPTCLHHALHYLSRRLSAQQTCSLACLLASLQHCAHS